MHRSGKHPGQGYGKLQFDAHLLEMIAGAATGRPAARMFRIYRKAWCKGNILSLGSGSPSLYTGSYAFLNCIFSDFCNKQCPLPKGSGQKKFEAKLLLPGLLNSDSQVNDHTDHEMHSGDPAYSFTVSSEDSPAGCSEAGTQPFSCADASSAGVMMVSVVPSLLW